MSAQDYNDALILALLGTGNIDAAHNICKCLNRLNHKLGVNYRYSVRRLQQWSK